MNYNNSSQNDVARKILKKRVLYVFKEWSTMDGELFENALYAILNKYMYIGRFLSRMKNSLTELL